MRGPPSALPPAPPASRWFWGGLDSGSPRHRPWPRSASGVPAGRARVLPQRVPALVWALPRMCSLLPVEQGRPWRPWGRRARVWGHVNHNPGRGLLGWGPLAQACSPRPQPIGWRHLAWSFLEASIHSSKAASLRVSEGRLDPLGRKPGVAWPVGSAASLRTTPQGLLTPQCSRPGSPLLGYSVNPLRLSPRRRGRAACVPGSGLSDPRHRASCLEPTAVPVLQAGPQVVLGASAALGSSGGCLDWVGARAG